MTSVLGKMTSTEAARKLFFLAFARSDAAKVEAVQPRACFFTECFLILVQ
jgi:hypothetical protein